MSTKVTVVIPARHEIFLNRTIDEVYAKAAGDIEIIVGLDGWYSNPLPEDRDSLTIIHWGKQRGHRAILNVAALIGTGDYIMKLDSHCALDEGFDVKLSNNCDDDWMVVPRRYSLDFENWTPQNKGPVDYEYIRYPYDEKGNFIGTTAKYYWYERQKARSAYDIDDSMICQGSCMFMPMNYFKKLIYPMDESSYGHYIGEQFEIMMKVWLSGGRCVVNKNTWYAHLWKGAAYRQRYLDVAGEKMPMRDVRDLRAQGIDHQTKYWLGNQWPNRIRDFEWLLEKFWPVPSWPKERELWTL